MDQQPFLSEETLLLESEIIALEGNYLYVKCYFNLCEYKSCSDRVEDSALPRAEHLFAQEKPPGSSTLHPLHLLVDLFTVRDSVQYVVITVSKGCNLFTGKTFEVNCARFTQFSAS